MHPGALLRLVAAAAAIELSLAATALSAPIGEAASVVPAANYTRNGGAEKPLAIRDTLEQNDRIRTTAAGSTRVRLLDDTMITIGPNSEVLLDQFVFDGNRAQKATVEVVRGAMRFVSGTSERRAYEIKTPAATIGVRGTVVDIGFVNGRWSFNTVDGTITATLTSTGETRSFSAGQPGFSVAPSGFVPINPSDATQLWRRLDGAHQQLAKAAGSSPSAPQGAAAGNQGNDGDVTGSVPGGNQGQGGNQGNQNTGNNPGGPPGTGNLYSTPPILNVVATTGSTNPITNAVFADLDAIMAASTAVLGPTGPGPAFTANPLSVHALGGDQSEIALSPVAEQLNRLLLDLSTAKWDGDANKAFRGGVFAGTNPVANDVNAVALGRVTATVAELQTVTSGPDVIYQIGRWTNGAVGYSQNGGVSGIFNMNANQGLHYIVFGHTNGLYDINNQFQIAHTVTFQLENATKPTWNTQNGTSAPGTFSGQLAVAFGTLAVSYGLQATVTMAEGAITLTTQGGIANPEQSGAVGSALGGINKRATAFASATSPGGALCQTCFAFIDFVPVARDKVGVNYLIEVNLPGIIEGAAVFGTPPPSTPVPSAVGGRPLAAVVDATGVIYANAATDGIAEISGSNVFINSISDQIYTRTKGTATSSEPGTFNSVGWERWTNGTYVDESSQAHTIPLDGGLHIIHGMPSTISSTLLTATKVLYSLVGGTSPTISDGSVAPGTLGANSKMAVDFSNSRIGLDLFLSIGGASYQMTTTGGTASVGPSSEISFNSSGIISGSVIPVSGNNELASCTSGLCTGSVAGFLSGFEATEAGLVYSLSNPSTTPLINGAAAFSRDFPVSTVGAFAYADMTSAANNHLVVGPAQDFNSSSQSVVDQAVVADNAKASGLSVQSFNLEVDTSSASSSVFGWHRLSGRITPDGSSVDQGVIANVLGWERLIGTLHQHTNNGGGPDMVLTANQGVHIIHGVAATNIPTNVTYLYDFTGGTSPTLADGSSAPGQMLNTSKVGVNFSNTAPKFGVDLKIDMQTAGSAGQYNILSSGGAAAPSLAASSLHSNGTFNASGITTTHTSGTNTVCTSGCTAAVSGFLAGDGAKNLGIIYQFGGSSAAKTVTGAAGFTKTP